MYERLDGLFTKEDLEKLGHKNILLVGVGGVGSPCFECLIRSGVRNITVYDHDTYELSNINRQLHANRLNLGKNKVDVIKDYTLNIDDSLNVEVHNEFISSNTIIDFSKYDYIIDACDSIEAKIFLAKSAKNYGVKFISSMGIGNRINPDMIKILKLSKVCADPLAKKFKEHLKKENYLDDIVCVASIENPKKLGKISSYITVTMAAGLMLADYVIKDIIYEN